MVSQNAYVASSYDITWTAQKLVPALHMILYAASLSFECLAIAIIPAAYDLSTFWGFGGGV